MIPSKINYCEKRFSSKYLSHNEVKRQETIALYRTLSLTGDIQVDVKTDGLKAEKQKSKLHVYI